MSQNMHSEHHPDLAMGRVIDAAMQAVDRMVADCKTCLADLSDDAAKAMLVSWESSEADPAELRRHAQRLCDEGYYRLALPVATQLLTIAPAEPAHAYLAATINHHLGLFSVAAPLYAMAAMANGEPVPLFRMAQCLEAMGKPEQALSAYQEAFESGRRGHQFVRLQDLADSAIRRLRKAPVANAAR